jgi:limonene-1,2-epoxide hydrolase
MTLADAQSRPEVEQIAIEFFRRWAVSFDELCASFEDVMAPVCRWEQRPMLVTNTRSQALRFLRVSRRVLRLATVEVELPYVTSVGNVVLTERIDHLLRNDGTLIASAPVAGVLEFDGRRVVAWREYFNAIGFAGQLPRNTLVRRHRRL